MGGSSISSSHYPTQRTSRERKQKDVRAVKRCMHHQHTVAWIMHKTYTIKSQSFSFGFVVTGLVPLSQWWPHSLVPHVGNMDRIQWVSNNSKKKGSYSRQDSMGVTVSRYIQNPFCKCKKFSNKIFWKWNTYILFIRTEVPARRYKNH